MDSVKRSAVGEGLQRAAKWAIATLQITVVPEVLALAAEETRGSGSFWEQRGDAIITAVVTAVVIAVLTVCLIDPVKKLRDRLGDRIGRWLASLGWRFERRYLQALGDQHQWLRLIGVYSRADLHPPRLREVFVSLRLATARADQAPRIAWNEALADPKGRTVVLGPPGSGKSTLLSYLVLVLTGRAPHRLREQLGRPLPLFARLRELDGRRTVLDLLTGSVQIGKVPPGYFERRLDKGGCCVLLDGLDEVLDEELHEQAVAQITRLINDYPDNCFVVTCRVAGWRHQLPDLRTFEIEQATGDDVHQFIGAWYREVLRTERINLLGHRPTEEQLKAAEHESAADAMERTASLWAALRDNESLLRIARTPLILSLITLVHFHRVTDLPKGRAKLYQQCLEILLDLWDRQDKRLRLAGPSLKEKLLVLRAIAYRLLEEDLLEADLATIEEVVEPLVGKLSEGMTAGKLVEIIWQRSGILVEQAIGRFGFAHRALLDYLAAEHIVENELDDRLVANAGEERWREVILVAVGLVPQRRATTLVRALLEREDAGAADLEIAGLSLAEDIQLGDNLDAQVRQRLLERLRSEGSAAGFGRLVTALMAADLEAAQQWMGEALESQDRGLQDKVLGLLPELGERHGRALAPLLLRIIGCEDAWKTVRARSAVALAGLGIEPDADGWHLLGEARRDRNLQLRRAATWAWCELDRYEELGLVKVPAGEFIMGSDEITDKERPQHRLYLPTFYIGRYPVTAARFREFLQSSRYKPVDPDCLKGQDAHPVVWITWYDARNYAEWFGGFLPSEAEWEKAARGTDGREYPWGNEWRPGDANTWEHIHGTGMLGRLFRRFARPGRGGTTPVGSFSPAGDSPYGCADMAGNVWEWTRSLWGKDWRNPDFRYPYSLTDDRENEDADKECLRVLRGGSFGYDLRLARCAYRGGNNPDNRNRRLGFRVVVAPSSLVSEPSDL